MQPRTDEQLKRLCRGCYNDRYNYKGTCERPGIDAPVTSDKCWSLLSENMNYCRSPQLWVLSCHTGKYERWLTEYAKTGKKPTWDWKR